MALILLVFFWVIARYIKIKKKKGFTQIISYYLRDSKPLGISERVYVYSHQGLNGTDETC